MPWKATGECIATLVRWFVVDVIAVNRFLPRKSRKTTCKCYSFARQQYRKERIRNSNTKLLHVSRELSVIIHLHWHPGTGRDIANCAGGGRWFPSSQYISLDDNTQRVVCCLSPRLVLADCESVSPDSLAVQAVSGGECCLFVCFSRRAKWPPWEYSHDELDDVAVAVVVVVVLFVSWIASGKQCRTVVFWYWFFVLVLDGSLSPLLACVYGSLSLFLWLLHIFFFFALSFLISLSLSLCVYYDCL